MDIDRDDVLVTSRCRSRSREVTTKNSGSGDCGALKATSCPSRSRGPRSPVDSHSSPRWRCPRRNGRIRVIDATCCRRRHGQRLLGHVEGGERHGERHVGGVGPDWRVESARWVVRRRDQRKDRRGRGGVDPVLNDTVGRTVGGRRYRGCREARARAPDVSHVDDLGPSGSRLRMAPTA